jgi:hypothetical protein
MSQQMNDLKPLFLSAEEAMGLLDLCMMSCAEFDREKEGVLLKLSDLVRQHLADDHSAVCTVVNAGREDAMSEVPERAPEDRRYAENALLNVSGTEFVPANRNAVRRAFLKPCPAMRFRSILVNSGA